MSKKGEEIIQKGGGAILPVGAFLDWDKSADKFTLSHFDVILLHVVP